MSWRLFGQIVLLILISGWVLQSVIYQIIEKLGIQFKRIPWGGSNNKDSGGFYNGDKT